MTILEIWKPWKVKEANLDGKEVFVFLNPRRRGKQLILFPNGEAEWISSPSSSRRKKKS